MGNKKKSDFSLESAAEQLTSFFFDIEEAVTPKEPTNERREQPVGNDEPEPEPTKPAKRVGNTFVAKKAGKADKPGKSKEAESGVSDAGADDPEGTSDE